MSDISEARAISYLCDALDDAPLIESARKKSAYLIGLSSFVNKYAKNQLKHV